VAYFATVYKHKGSASGFVKLNIMYWGKVYCDPIYTEYFGSVAKLKQGKGCGKVAVRPQHVQIAQKCSLYNVKNNGYFENGSCKLKFPLEIQR